MTQNSVRVVKEHSSLKEIDKMIKKLEIDVIDHDGDGIRERNGEDFEVIFPLSTGMVSRWPYRAIAGIVQAQLRDIGMRVNIEEIEAGLWSERLKRCEVEISMRPWVAISPQERLHSWLHSNGTNVINMGIFYSNPEMDILIEELKRTTDEEEAKRLAIEIQELAAQDILIIPVYDEILVNAVRDNIRGYKLHPWFTVNWEDIYVVA